MDRREVREAAEALVRELDMMVSAGWEVCLGGVGFVRTRENPLGHEGPQGAEGAGGL